MDKLSFYKFIQEKRIPLNFYMKIKQIYVDIFKYLETTNFSKKTCF